MDDILHTSSGIPEERRLRVARACSHCRAAKSKCSGEEPCASCVKRGLTCDFPTELPKRRGPLPGFRARRTDRVGWTEPAVEGDAGNDRGAGASAHRELHGGGQSSEDDAPETALLALASSVVDGAAAFTDDVAAATYAQPPRKRARGADPLSGHRAASGSDMGARLFVRRPSVAMSATGGLDMGASPAHRDAAASPSLLIGAAAERPYLNALSLQDVFELSGPILPTKEEQGFIRAFFLFTDHTMPMFEEARFQRGLRRAAALPFRGHPAPPASLDPAAAASEDASPPWTADCDDALGFRVLYFTILALGSAVQGRRREALGYNDLARAFSGACFARPSEYMAAALAMQAFMTRLIMHSSPQVVLQSMFMARGADQMARACKFSANTRINAAFLARLLTSTLSSIAVADPPSACPPEQDAVDRLIDLLWFLLTQLESDFPSGLSADAILAFCDEAVSLATRHDFLPAMPWTVLRITVRLIVHIKKGGPMANVDEVCAAYAQLRTDERSLRAFSLVGLLARVVLDLAHVGVPGAPLTACAPVGGAYNSMTAERSHMLPTDTPTSQLIRVREAASRFLLESAKIGAAPFPPEYHLMQGLAAGMQERTHVTEGTPALVMHGVTGAKPLPMSTDRLIGRHEVMAVATGIAAAALEVAARLHGPSAGTQAPPMQAAPIQLQHAFMRAHSDGMSGFSMASSTGFALGGGVALGPFGAMPAASPPSPVYSMGGSIDSEGKARLSVLDFVFSGVPTMADSAVAAATTVVNVSAGTVTSSSSANPQAGNRSRA